MDQNIEAAVERANAALRLADSGQLGSAIEILQEVVASQPSMVGARVNLGALLDRAGQSETACEQLKAAIRLQPDLAEAWNNLGLALFHLTRIRAAFDAFTRAVQIRPDYFEAHSNRSLMPLYRIRTGEWLDKSLTDWRQALTATKVKKENPRRPEPRGVKPLKIGFVSPDFRVHSVAYFLLPVIDYWAQQSDLELYLYSDVISADETTERFRSLPLNYLSTQDLSNQQLIERIRGDRIEILFELSGHFTHNRLPVFAERAAPFQIAWLGYPISSGTPNIDFRIADEISAPRKSDGAAEEQVVRLDTGYHCYLPPKASPAIQAGPVSLQQPFTFGCFNNAFKISPEIARIWGLILENNPNCQLLLKAKSFANGKVREQILNWIHKEPSVRERIEFRSRDESLIDHLNTYNRIDLALDTFPYSGTTTTCESLWMGVPCITLCGNPPQSRVGASLLNQAKLQHFITHSAEQYVQLASLLAAQPEKLKSYRSGLRSHLNKTPLRDPTKVGEALLQRLRKLAENGTQTPAGD